MCDQNLEKLHKLCFNGKDVYKKYTHVGCFHCLTVFHPDEIEECVDNDKTALCPYCSIDAVIPMTQATKSERDHTLITMQNRYF